MQSVRRTLTKYERTVIYDKCGGHCAYCGDPLDFHRMQVDHVKPIAKGGKDTIENMLPACGSCNYYKATFSLEEYRAVIQKWLVTLRRESGIYRNLVRYGLLEPKPHRVVFYFEKKQEGWHETQQTHFSLQKEENHRDL